MRRKAWALPAAVLVTVTLAATSTSPAGRAVPRPPTVVDRAPVSATVVISAGGSSSTFTPSTVSVGGGGTVTVVNLDSIDHTFTSVAVDGAGDPLFDTRIPPGQTATVPATAALANDRYRFYCRYHPSMQGTLVVTDSSGPITPDPPTFTQALVRPPVVRGPRIRIPMTRARVRMLPAGPTTWMWTYDGTFPGPTIRRPAGHDTRVTYVNRLPRRAGAFTVHLHGDHHASKHDGQPTTHLIRHGRSRTYHYPLTIGHQPEPSSFFFYHDHRMDHTARNNWRGLMGMFIVSDGQEKKLRLPTGARDLPLMVADRSFGAKNVLADPFLHGPTMTGHHGQMAWMGEGAPPNDHTIGSHVLVNGRYHPFTRVTATRYRLRLLNASHFSAYTFMLSDGRPFVQIGTGNGLLHRPVVRNRIMLGPAQRADVLVDFHGEVGQKVVLWSMPNRSSTTGSRQAALLQFRVVSTAPDPSRLPSTLPSPRLVKVPERVSKRWVLGLGGDPEHGTFWSINGKAYDPARVDHRARLGTVERWRLRNDTDMTHYVHIHAEQWRTVMRNGKRPPPWERGLEDTWRLEPGDVVDVAARFRDYTGPFMIHCHMLDHEDHGMMARFDVVR